MKSCKKPYFRFSKPEPVENVIIWPSSTIKMRNTGRWFVFTEQNFQLNQDRPCPRNNRKKYYKYRGYQVPPEMFDYSDNVPLNTEVSTNYNYFVPSRELISTVQERERTQVYEDDQPMKSSRKGFVGKNPLTMPIRTSTKILNEKRFQELHRAPRKIQTVRSPRRTYRESADTDTN